MHALNLLLLRLIATDPAIIINSQTKGLIDQIEDLCSGSTLNPVNVSTEDMQSLVFILPNSTLPPFSFVDISNVWIEDDGEGGVQLRKAYKSFHVKNALAEILLEFKDLGYWNPEYSFSISLINGRSNTDTCVQGIQDRIDFLESNKGCLQLAKAQEEVNRLVKDSKYQEAAELRDKMVSLKAEVRLEYKKRFSC